MATITTPQLPDKGMLVMKVDLKNGTSIVIRQDLQKENKAYMFSELIPRIDNFIMVYDTEQDNCYVIPVVEIEYIEMWLDE